MKAMILEERGRPLREVERPRPEPGPGEVVVDVLACAVCRTDLHVVDGDLEDGPLPIVPGHEIVGRVSAVGPEVQDPSVGTVVGIPWLGGACAHCPPCARGEENLCDDPTFTGYTVDGGFAEATRARADFVLPLPEGADPIAFAPLLCAGLIGYRSYAMAGSARRLGFLGFGAAAHLLAQLAVHEGRELFAFTRPGDTRGQRFARGLGAVWAGGSDETPPSELDAAIIFAPVGDLVPKALRDVRKGGVVVCAGIHMSDIPSFPYATLWGERTLRSVANLTRADGHRFLKRAAEVPIRAETITYRLSEANRALDDLREGRFDGAAVLVPDT